MKPVNALEIWINISYLPSRRLARGYYLIATDGIGLVTPWLWPRSIFDSSVIPGPRLGANWEGPFQVMGAGARGTYALEDKFGREVPRRHKGGSLRRLSKK